MHGNHCIHAVECVLAMVSRKNKKSKKEENMEPNFPKPYKNEPGMETHKSMNNHEKRFFIV